MLFQNRKNSTHSQSPTPITCYASQMSDTEAVFNITPLKRTKGDTIGNAMRRTVLSGLRGAAIVAVKIEGALHEFSTLPGIREDVIFIIQNLKGVVFKYTGSDPKFKDGTIKMKATLKTTGPCVAVAAMIESHPDLKVVNPDHIICTVSASTNIHITMYVQMGIGYLQSDNVCRDNYSDMDLENLLFIDTKFNPVERCNYKVVTMGGAVVTERLELSISTNGSITPEEALQQAATELARTFSVFAKPDEETDVSDEQESTPQLNPVFMIKIEDCELSVRSQNCLLNENIVYIGDLVIKTESELLKTPNFGRKSLNEIKALLFALGLQLGMNNIGWPPANLTEELSKQTTNDSATI